MVKNFEILKSYQNKTWRHEANKCCWKNNTDRLAQCRVTTTPLFVKTAVSVKHNKAKCDKTRCACITLYKFQVYTKVALNISVLQYYYHGSIN